jgi:hypothetical protein
MELNKENLTAIADLIKVDAATLETALTTAEGKFETDVKHFLTDKERKELETNIQKQGYDTGKLAGSEMSFRVLKDNFKETLKIDTESIVKGDYNALFDAAFGAKNEAKNLEIEELKGKLTGNVKDVSDKYDALLNVAGNEKAALQTLNEQLKLENKNAIDDLTSKFKKEKSQGVFISNINNIPFIVPTDIERQGADAIKGFLQREKLNFQAIFFANHQLKYDENENLLILENNEILKDDVQNPVKISDILIPLARKYNFKLEKDAGSKKRSSGNKTAKFANMSQSDFMKDNDLTTNEGIKAYAEWKAANK